MNTGEHFTIIVRFSMAGHLFQKYLFNIWFLSFDIWIFDLIFVTRYAKTRHNRTLMQFYFILLLLCTVPLKGNVALARNIFLITRSTTTRTRCLPSRVLKPSTQKSLYACVHMKMFINKLFSFEAPCYRAFLCCKRLPWPRLVFL